MPRVKILFFLILTTSLAYGQTYDAERNLSQYTNPYLINLFYNSMVVKSKYEVDSVDYVGVKADSIGHIYRHYSWEEHNWLYEDTNQPRYTSCLVLHGKEGCSNNWFSGYRICRVCYRKEFIHEQRWAEKIKTEIEILNERVDSLKGKQ